MLIQIYMYIYVLIWRRGHCRWRTQSLTNGVSWECNVYCDIRLKGYLWGLVTLTSVAKLSFCHHYVWSIYAWEYRRFYKEIMQVDFDLYGHALAQEPLLRDHEMYNLEDPLLVFIYFHLQINCLK